MQKLIVLFAGIVILSACSTKRSVVKVNFKESLVPIAPDYSKSEHWASLPDKADAADSVPKKSGLKDLQERAKADVFFVHPTTFTEKPTNQYQWNPDVSTSFMDK